MTLDKVAPYQNGSFLWASNTSGQNCGANLCYAAFQGDGNFVVYNGSTPIWNSQTNGNPGAQLVLSEQAPYIEIMGSNQSVLWDNSTPDPAPDPYPNDLSSPPSSPAGSCNVTGTWIDGASSGTWSLTQIGNALTGSLSGTPPAQYGCSRISWQVSGQISGSVASLTASSPNPAVQSCSSGLQWTASNPLTATVTFSNCNTGAANENATYPAGSQFAPGGGGSTTLSGSGPWSLASNPLTFTLSSPSQMPIPGLSNNAQMVPISIADSPQLTTTASVNSYSFNVTYPTQFFGNPHSTCQASLSIPSASGSATASSNMSAPNGCGGIFTVSGSIGQSYTQNSLYVVAPPDILIRELWGEANTQAATGDQVSELAVGNTIRQRFGDAQYFKGFNNYQDMANNNNRGFDGLNRCAIGCLSTVAHGTETVNAAYIYGGVNTPATDVADAKCFASPTPDDWNNHILPALQSRTTVYPAPLVQETGCFAQANRQIIYKTSVANNVSYRGAQVPAFVFVQWRLPSAPAVIQIP